MADLVVRLMIEEAERRFADGEALQSVKQTDSAYLLKLLGFELALKALLFIEKNQNIETHKYLGMFNSLSAETKASILKEAQKISQNFDLSAQITEILKWYESNFIKLRYPYQNYEQMSEKEYKEYSDLYMQLGCPEGEAEFEYYPEELRGLFLSMMQHIKIANKSLNSQATPAGTPQSGAR